MFYMYEEGGMVVFVGKGREIESYFWIMGSEFKRIGYEINNGFGDILKMKYGKGGREGEVGDDVYVGLMGK